MGMGMSHDFPQPKACRQALLPQTAYRVLHGGMAIIADLTTADLTRRRQNVFFASICLKVARARPYQEEVAGTGVFGWQ